MDPIALNTIFGPGGSALVVFLGAYFIGSIPFGFIVGKMRGIDIREHGSGNIGATNVLRTLGKPLGIATFLLDVLKGLGPVLFVTVFLFHPDTPRYSTILQITAAVGAIVGHNFPVWLKFKGGKGIATSAGALLPILPIPLAVALVIWIVVFFTSRYVSLASIVAAVSIPLTLVVMMIRNGWNAPVLTFASVLALLAVWRHRANVSRLLNGTENRFERKRKSTPSNP